MFDRALNTCCRWLDWLAAAMLAVMVVLVFGNVVLRYAFNSGISLSEELSRWLFVWITFIGAAVALKERRHLGTDFLLTYLPRAGKKICLVLAYLLMLYACWMLFSGAWEQVKINWTTTSAVMEARVSYFYASGLFFAVFAAMILLRDLLHLFSRQLSDEELVMFRSSEDLHPVDVDAHRS